MTHPISPPTFSRAVRLFVGFSAVAVLLATVCPPAVAQGVNGDSKSKFTVFEKDGAISVSEGDARVLVYQRAETSQQGKFVRSNYIHPLFDLEGHELTEDFPADHRHHRGIFWGWHQLWMGQKQLGDAWALKNFSWDIREVKSKVDDQTATLQTDLYWKSSLANDANGEPLALVREQATIRVHPATKEFRNIDFDILLLALQPELTIGGSEDDKGYSGFSVRVRLPKDIEFLGQKGSVAPETNAIAAGPWIDMSGSLTSDSPSGVTMLQHPTLPSFPQAWILRSSRSMQNAAYPGRTPVPLSMDKPLILRYRLVIHRGRVTAATIENWQKEYAVTMP